MGTITNNWNSRPELVLSFWWHKKTYTQGEMKQKLQNAFAESKNIEVLREGWEETLATDILSMKEKIIQQGKYAGIKHQRNFKLLHDSPRSVGCALLTVVPLDHETGRYVQLPTLAVQIVTLTCSHKSMCCTMLHSNPFPEVWHQVTPTDRQQGKMVTSAPCLSVTIFLVS